LNIQVNFYLTLFIQNNNDLYYILTNKILFIVHNSFSPLCGFGILFVTLIRCTSDDMAVDGILVLLC